MLGGSALVLLACLGLPPRPLPSGDPMGRAGMHGIAGDVRFWIFVAAASALQASHQLYYGFGTLRWRSLRLSETTIG